MAKASRKHTAAVEQLRAIATHWRRRADEYRRQGNRLAASNADKIALRYERALARGQGGAP